MTDLGGSEMTYLAQLQIEVLVNRQRRVEKQILVSVYVQKQ